MQEFPLGQEDVYDLIDEIDPQQEGKHEQNIDYTPPEHVELFFTDLGIYTSSGISDELTQFFSN
jgi:translation initiation factor 2B subunit (eIF-2B alpha/beta/delta family)